MQLAALKRELEEALAAGRGAQGMKEECASLKQELKLLKDERYTPRQAAATPYLHTRNLLHQLSNTYVL